jgi:hypothetical protein
MKARLFDILDLNRPLARAARDFDWTEVVNLFPEATSEGMTAARVWVLASMIVLGDVMGLSEGEVLSRWPENPYWQAFSGYEHFQWETPVTETDCHAFRRHLDAARSARLAAIAKSIRESKSIERKLTSPVEAKLDSSGDAVLALRKVHFIQPQTISVYKAPTRLDFPSSVKQAYAKAAPAAAKEKSEPAAKQDSAPPVPGETEAAEAASKEASPAVPKGSPPRTTQEKSASSKKPEAQPEAETAAAAAATPAGEAPSKSDEQTSGSIQSQPEPFTQTYSALFRRKPLPQAGSAVPSPSPAPPTAPEFLTAEVRQTAPPQLVPPVSSMPSNIFGAAPETESMQSPAQIQAMFRTTVARPNPEPQTAASSPFSVQLQDSARKPRPVAPAGSPQFDDSTPKVIRAVAGEAVTLEVVVSGEAPLKYQWEQWDDVKGISLPIEGCTEPSLTIAMEPEDSMLAFQCRVSNIHAPEGVVSRTFFTKRVTSSQKTSNSFGEKFDPKLFSSGRV